MSIQSDPQLQGIKELMVNSGLSEEAAGKICEVMIGYGNDYKRRVDEEYTARVEQARKICIEETEAHKLELGRRMQIFLEAKDHQIGQTLARQNAGREGDAQQILARVQAMLEGVPAGGDVALKSENDKLQRTIRKLKEERDKATVTANRQTELAEKVMKRNRLIESRLTELERSQRQPRPTKPVSEARAGNGPNQPRRLDNGRTGAAPRTTRSTLVESQDPTPPRDTRQSHLQTQTMPNGPMTPSQIAETMEDVP